jgi:alkylation response protein AidB-like acyl-CoA dehydrogenase
MEKVLLDWNQLCRLVSDRALHPDGYTVLAIVDHAEGVEVINDWNGFGQRTTASGTVKLHNVVVDPALFFDERIIADTKCSRCVFSTLQGD